MAFEPDGVEELFRAHFQVECMGKTDGSGLFIYLRGNVTYLMTRKEEQLL